MWERFEDGEAHLKKIEGRVIENERTQLKMLEIELGNSGKKA